MEPCSFDGENGVLNPPEGVSEADCSSISCMFTTDGKIVTCWKVTKEELEEITRTGRVWMISFGGMSPTILMGTNPFQ